MGRAYSQDLRERVMAAVDSGTGAYAAASIFRVSVSYIYKVLGRRKTTGETGARPWAGGPKPKLAAHDEALRAQVMSEPDATLAELQAWLIAEHDLKVSIGCLWKRLRQLGLTLKKSLRAAEQDRADIAKAREEWRASQPDLNPEHLVFIDETGAKTNLARLYGRAPRGQRLIAPVPHRHWMTTTFVAALRHDEITAPCVFDGPMDGASFLTYVEHFLAPTLRQGDVVVLDNLASHKVAGVKEAIERAGATLRYLPAYSPDFNPIEQAFAKLKAALRKAAARTFDALVNAIAQALADFTAQECANYIANSGYRRQS
ncbi:MAG: IS630 family transposase [bacterium]